MGVKGLWQLLDPVGKPVTLESMEGKTLAVDVSIWLHQSVHGMRDAHGDPVPNAHLIGIFNRVCKLLFYHIKPIFVFDGGVPALKKQTLMGRRQRRKEATDRSAHVKRKMLDRLLKQQAVQAVLSQHTGQNLPRASVTPLVNNKEPDMYLLPPLPEADADRHVDEIEEAFQERAAYRNLLYEEFQDIDQVDPESEDLKALPVEIQHELLTELKEARKHTDWTSASDLPTQSEDFSNFQLTRLMRQSRLTQRLKDVRDEINNQASGDIANSLLGGATAEVIESRRVVSEDSSHYILIKGLNKESKRSVVAAATASLGSEDASNEQRQTASEIQGRSMQSNASEIKAAPHDTWMESDTNLTEGGIPNSTEFSENKEEPKLIHSVSKFKEMTTTLPNNEAEFSSITEIVIDDDDQDLHTKTLGERDLTKPTITELDGSEGANFETKSSVSLDKFGDFSASHTMEQRLELDSDKDEDCLDVTEGGFIRDDDSDVEPLNAATDSKHTQDETCRTRADKENYGSVSSSVRRPDSPTDQQKIAEQSECQPGNSRTTERNDSKNTTCDGSWDDTTPVPDNTRENQANKIVAASLKTSGIDADLEPVKHSDNDSDENIDHCHENTLSQVHRECSLPKTDASKCGDILDENGDSMTEIDRSDGKRKRLESQEEMSEKVVILDDEQVDEDGVVIISDDEDTGQVPSPQESDEDEGFIEITIDPETAVPDDDLFPASIFTPAQNQTDQSAVAPVFTPQTPECLGESVRGKQTSTSKAGPKDMVLQIDEQVVRPSSGSAALSTGELLELQQQLANENVQLQKEVGQEERLAASITDQMMQEAQELLRLFGVPFITSPMEAEAQCAHLDLTNQTQGTITDDSDIWLFGGRTVYKNMFNQSKHVELFTSARIQSQLLLDREKMVYISLLCGSDYTEGVEGIGPVTAMEVLGEFRGGGFGVLQDFKRWWDLAQQKPAPSAETKIKSKLRKVSLSESFPNPAVVEAYTNPQVDHSQDPFSWGVPDLGLLRDYAKDKFGWMQSKADKALLPVMKEVTRRSTQRHITSYLNVDFGEPRRLKSKRVKRMINKIRQEAETSPTKESNSTGPASSPSGETTTKDSSTKDVTGENCRRRVQRKSTVNGQTAASRGRAKSSTQLAESTQRSGTLNQSSHSTVRRGSRGGRGKARGSKGQRSSDHIRGKKSETVRRHILEEAGLSESSSGED